MIQQLSESRIEAAKYRQKMANLEAIWEPIFRADTELLLKLVTEIAKDRHQPTLEAIDEIASEIMTRYTAGTQPIDIFDWIHEQFESNA